MMMMVWAGQHVVAKQSERANDQHIRCVFLFEPVSAMQLSMLWPGIAGAVQASIRGVELGD